MHPVRQNQWLKRSGLALTGIRNKTVPATGPSTGCINEPEAMFMSVLEALAERPLTLAELAELPALRDQNLATVLETAAFLVGDDQALPFFANSCQAEVQQHDRHPCENTEKGEAK